MFKLRMAAFTAALLAAVTATASAQQATQAGVGAAGCPRARSPLLTLKHSRQG